MERENRYIVIKRKDLDLLTDEAKEELENILTALSIAKQPDIDTGAEGDVSKTVVIMPAELTAQRGRLPGVKQ